MYVFLLHTIICSVSYQNNILIFSNPFEYYLSSFTRCCPYGSSQANTNQMYYPFRLIFHFLHIPRECKKYYFHFFKCLCQWCENKDKLGTPNSLGLVEHRDIFTNKQKYYFCPSLGTRRFTIILCMSENFDNKMEK